MARIRTIKPEFWAHHKTARVSRDARLLFLGLLNEADDHGRLVGSAKRIAGVVFPHDDDATPGRVGGWLDELEATQFILRYEEAGALYIWLIGFTSHQKVQHPTDSRFPPPPELFVSPSGAAPEMFGPDLGTGNREQVSRNREGATRRVFDAWVIATGKSRAVLDDKRRRVIDARLKEFPEEDLVEAVGGWRNSGFHCGQNDSGKVYNDLALLLRDAQHVESFLEFSRGGTPVPRMPKNIGPIQRAVAARVGAAEGLRAVGG